MIRMARQAGIEHARDAAIQRLLRIVNQWAPSTARWVKMAMKAFKMPGGEGGLREPYRNAGPAELKSFVDGLATKTCATSN